MMYCQPSGGDSRQSYAGRPLGLSSKGPPRTSLRPCVPEAESRYDPNCSRCSLSDQDTCYSHVDNAGTCWYLGTKARSRPTSCN